MNAIRPVTLSMVIGDPVDHSLSPMFHNAGYRILGIDSDFYYFKRNVSVNHLSSVMAAVRSLQIKGISVTAPLKQSVMDFLDEIDEAAESIGAVNTVVNTDGKLKGLNTDWIGVITPLKEATELKNKSVAVIGAGGAARAAIYALRDSVDRITVLNRTIDNANALSQMFGVEAEPLDKLKDIAEFDIVLQTVPSASNRSIKEQLKRYARPGQLLFNFAYALDEAPFLKAVESAGVKTIDGYEMLFYQALEQFKLFTGQSAPEQELRVAMRSFLERVSHD